MKAPSLADLDAATAATAAALADPSADLTDVYLAAAAEEAAYAQIFTGPCDRQPSPLAAYLEAEPEPEIEL